MKPTGPVNGDVALAAIQTSGALHTATSADPAKLEESVENRAIVSHVEPTLFLGIAIHVVGSDFLQEINVLVGVKLRHLTVGSGLRALCGRLAAIPGFGDLWAQAYIYLHLLIYAIVHDQAVR